MKKVASVIVELRALFALLFIALIIFSCFSAGWVSVENDITEYLPESAEAKKGLTIMADEFVAYATADVMVSGVSEHKAEALYEELCDIEGVFSVSFDLTEDHYKSQNALYNISFSGPSTDENAIRAMEDVRALVKNYDSSVSSSSFSNLADTLSTEMIGVGVIVVFVVIGVLVFTSTNYAEILVLLGTFLAAAIINLGTNFLMGTISFVSNSVTIVLQLALSVDYAIIFCNRYKEEHASKPIKEAVISALAQSIPEISASSLTTIAGLGAMTFMQFRLGMDMGLALIKSIVISLMSVFLFMPVLLVWLGKAMDKTRHRSFVPEISFAGKCAYAMRFVLPPLFVAFAVFAYISFGQVKYDYSSELVEIVHRNEEDLAARRIQSVFGKNNLIAVLVPSGDYEKEAALINDLEKLDEVNSVLGLAGIDAPGGYKLGDNIGYREFMELADVDETTARAALAYYAAGQSDRRSAVSDPDSYTAPIADLFLTIHDAVQSGALEVDSDKLTLIDELYAQLKMGMDQLKGRNYSRIVVYVDLPTQGDDTFAFLEKLHVAAAGYYSSGVVLTGQSVSAKGFYDTFESDVHIVSLLSVGLVMLILLFTFRSLGMPLLLITVIQGSIWINFSIMVWTGKYVFFMCYLITSAIQMGANIDYAIVISSRYNSLRGDGTEPRKAIIETLNFAFPTVVTSGLMMVIAGLMIGVRVSQPVIAGMGMHVGIGTTISLLLVNFVLPTILVFGDSFIRATTIPTRSHKAPLLLRIGRVTCGCLLSLSAILSLVILPSQYTRISDMRLRRGEDLATLIDSVDELREIASELSDTEELNSLKYSFAEGVVAGAIGEEALLEGEAAIEEGQKKLDNAKAQLAGGYSRYGSAKEQYQAGLAAYNDGAAKIAAAQAEYDAGAAALEAAKQEAAEGEAQLAAAAPLYNAVIPYYNEYLALQQQYNEAVAAGDEETAAALSLKLAAAKAVFETQLSSSGKSVSQIIAEYESGKRRLEEGKAKIADGEAQLADAKAQLDAGYAELAAAKAVLDDAEKQLSAAHGQLSAGSAKISAGEAELDEAKAQLEEGRETLAEKQQAMADSILELDSYTSSSEKLHAGAELLLGIDGIADITGKDASDRDIVIAACRYFESKRTELSENTRTAYIMLILLAFSALVLLLSGLLSLFKVYRAAGWYAVLGAIPALASQFFWSKYCSEFGGYFPLSVAVLAGLSLVFAILMLLSKKAAARLARR